MTEPGKLLPGLGLDLVTWNAATLIHEAPAGSAKRKNGSVEAVCVNATRSGLAPIDTISHADPTPCMNVPTSDTTSAMSS